MFYVYTHPSLNYHTTPHFPQTVTSVPNTNVPLRFKQAQYPLIRSPAQLLQAALFSMLCSP